MNTFLDLSYYKGKNIIFPNHLKPKVESNFVGIITHYVKFSKTIYGLKLFETLHDKKDENVLEKLILKHGVFFEKFYEKSLRFRINNFLKYNQDTTVLIDLCNQYYNKEYKRAIAIKFIKEDFIKVSLTNLKNEFLYKKLLDSAKAYSKTKRCEICGNYYKVIDFPDWVYYGSNGNISICYECPINHKVKKSEMIPLIKEFVNECKFIPNSDFNPINHNFSSRFESNHWVNVCRIIFDLGIVGNAYSSNKKINQKFGSWFEALVDSKVLPNGTLKTNRGIKCIAKSGNVCLSLDEMFIDNWFFDNNIKTEKEPYYPKHFQYNKNGMRRADWRINEYYIEYFGLKGEESYDKKTKEKIELAKTLEIKLIPLYPSDLSNLKEIFSKLKTTANIGYAPGGK